jgi:hypothetical protein
MQAAGFACLNSLSSFTFAFRVNTSFDMPPKRYAISEVPSRRVRTQADSAGDALLESMTIEERAKPFRSMNVVASKRVPALVFYHKIMLAIPTPPSCFSFWAYFTSTF